MTRNRQSVGVTPAMAEGYPVLEGSWTKGTSIPESAGITRIGSTGMWARVGEKVYIFSADSPNTYIYNIQGDSWTAAERMPTPRRSMASIAVENKIYCIGGQAQNGNTWANSAVVEIFYPASNSWTTGAEMPTAQNNMVCLQWKGNIYCFGSGNNQAVVYKYDVVANSWTELEAAPTSKNSSSAHVLTGNRIYWVNGKEQDNFEVFDLETESWSIGPNIPSRRNSQSYMAALDNKVYCIAGNYTTATDYYNTETRLWHGAAAKPTNDYFGILLQDGTTFYCIGGLPSTAFEIYNVASNTWQVAEDIPYPVGFYSPVFLEGNKIYCIGNEKNTEVHIFQLREKQEHLIRLQYRSETGASLLADELRSVTEGSDFSITAPSIGNHTCVGCQVDGGALQAAPTATLQAVSGGHIIVFVYRPKEDGSGDDACNRCGCTPCCCKQHKLEYRSSTILTVPEEEALARIAKALGPVDINGMHGFSSDF